MWKCFDCNRRFDCLFPSFGQVCPYCGGPAFLNLEHIRSGRVVPTDDASVISNLRRCGTEWPDIFNLVWGTERRILNVLPEEHRKIVTDILLEITKEEESDDLIDKKLHRIIIDLLYVLYEKQVNDYMKIVVEKMNTANKLMRR